MRLVDEWLLRGVSRGWTVNGIDTYSKSRLQGSVAMSAAYCSWYPALARFLPEDMALQ